MGVTCVTGEVGPMIVEMLKFVKSFALSDVTIVMSSPPSAPQWQEFCTNKALW